MVLIGWDLNLVEQFLLSLQWRRVCKNHDNKVIWSVLKNRKVFVEVFIYNFGGRRPESTLPFLIMWFRNFGFCLGGFLGELTMDPVKRRGFSFRCFLFSKRKNHWSYSYPSYQDKRVSLELFFSLFAALDFSHLLWRCFSRTTWLFYWKRVGYAIPFCLFWIV